MAARIGDTGDSCRMQENELSSTFNKATDCLCPSSIQQWDGNSDVVKKPLKLLELQVTGGQVKGASVCGPKKRQCDIAPGTSINS